MSVNRRLIFFFFFEFSWKVSFLFPLSVFQIFLINCFYDKTNEFKEKNQWVDHTERIYNFSFYFLSFLDFYRFVVINSRCFRGDCRLSIHAGTYYRFEIKSQEKKEKKQVVSKNFKKFEKVQGTRGLDRLRIRFI